MVRRTQKVKQMMLMMIMRSNKALTLDIGPFSTMTLDTLPRHSESYLLIYDDHVQIIWEAC
ncbi:hypothetical protein NQ317_012092 [Molorchus minor]|uniref:Uncharacterized protein n=1 Tax=Molorchus minor TaxID=1323400 RepID=A0ABQ9JKR1_9CUCU|nr:hypothetical protein NQ317_012092 [Molorchus minor]